MKRWTHDHKFETDDGQCTICGNTASEILEQDKESGRYCKKWGHTWNMGGTCIICKAERGLQPSTTNQN